MVKKVSGWILLLLSFNTLALTETRLTQLSTSGQTVVFDAGVHERFVDSEFGIILKRVVDDIHAKTLRVVPVAKVRSVKVGTDHSIWVIFKKYQDDLLTVGDKYILFTESNMIPARREYTTNKVTVVTPHQNSKNAARVSLADDSDLLAKDKNFVKNYQNHPQSYKGSDDFELIELEKWSKLKGQRYRTGLYRSQNAEQFKHALRLEVFEGLVTKYLERVNDPNFNYEEFYSLQQRDMESNYFRKRSNFSTEWEEYQAIRNQSIATNAKLARNMLERGDRWSEEYSDEELGSLLNKIGMTYEKDRQRRVISRPSRYSAAFNYSQIVSNHQTADDAKYNRNFRYVLNMDLEYNPLIKHPTFERFTIVGQLSLANDAIAVGARNYDRVDQSFTLGVNWYPFYTPYTVDVMNFYVGTFFRAGQSKIRSEVYDEKGNYSLMSFPGIRVGVRYNLRNKIDIRLAGSFETVVLERTGSDLYYTSLPESYNITDMHVSLGMGYSF